jgi:S1-C subfamily serine protease
MLPAPLMQHCDTRGFRSNRPAVLAPIASALLVAGMLTGCVTQTVDEADWDRRTTRLLQARKAGSQVEVGGDRIAGEPAGQYVIRRTALLLGGAGRVTTTVAPSQRSAMVGWELRPGEKGGGVSSAAAITPDGYYLTAAHAVDESRLRVVRANGRGVDLAKARIVWSGDPSRGGPDLALIHAPAKGLPYFPLVGTDVGSPRMRVWTGGFGDLRQNQARGRLRGTSTWQEQADGARWRTVEHTAPLMQGDSGGPLVDADGRLLGVNTEFLIQPASLLGYDHLRLYRPVAMAPDPAWIESLIMRDRASGKSGSKARNRRVTS